MVIYSCRSIGSNRIVAQGSLRIGRPAGCQSATPPGERLDWIRYCKVSGVKRTFY